MPDPIVVAGHICLDIIPDIATPSAALGELMRPGALVNVGRATISTGGAVANTGLALHKLGDEARLIGKVGADHFGEIIRRVLGEHDESLTRYMIVDDSIHTSYSIVISPPGIDRVFLHSAGANDTFCADDLLDEHLDGARLFHFGYPPIMRNMYENDGAELEKLLGRAKAAGLVTSLDLSMPDPVSEAGSLNWPTFFKRVLPSVDFILPSIEEIAFMLKHPATVEQDNLRHISEWLLRHGAGAVAIKLGDRGFYLRTSPDAERLRVIETLGCNVTDWTNRELLNGCYEANVVGTTGAGDCTIAGFLSELSRGGSPDQAADFATAVGACSVEAPDATGGIKPRPEIEARTRAGWGKKR